ncbi:MAG: hypothetical protein HKO69_01570 [Woeseiaceae bacterium]|nr:hypothetical protein [Woeseiaceae bacterium]
MHRAPLITLILAGILLATTAARAEYLAAIDDWPEWVREGMAKEKRLKFRAVTTPDDSFSSRMPGKPRIEAIENGWYFLTDMRAGSPLECHYYTTSRDLGTLTDLLTEANIEAVVKNGGTLGERQLFQTGAGEVAGMPYISLEWIYTIQQDGQTLVGFTKVRAATKGEAAFACAHNYLGYRETFAGAFAEFVTGANFEDASPQPFYEEIARLDMNGIGSGITHVSYTTDEEGYIRAQTVEAAVMPVDASTVVASDSYTISFSTPGGELLNAYDISVEDGELTANMRLQRNEQGDWVSSGMLQGKDLEYEIDGALQPHSELQQIAMARELFAGETTSLDGLAWLPTADPTKFLEATMTRDDAEVERQARVTIGPLSFTGRFDVDGNLSDAAMNVGPASIRIERIWFRGSMPR